MVLGVDEILTILTNTTNLIFFLNFECRNMVKWGWSEEVEMALFQQHIHSKHPPQTERIIQNSGVYIPPPLHKLPPQPLWK